MWSWLDSVRKFFDNVGKKILGHLDLGNVGDMAVGESASAASKAVDGLLGGGGVDAFETAFQEEIKLNVLQQYMLGRGGREAMSQADWGSCGGMIGEQYKYLDGFLAEIRDGALSDEQIRARAEMYINSGREGFERAHGRNAEDLGMDTEEWIVDPTLENCPDCLAFQEEGPQPIGHFPKPGAGHTQCLCIVSPWSGVQTGRGIVPLCKVSVGDSVLTHKGRWREVTGVVVKPSTGNERLAMIRAPGGDWVACTDTHLWRTESGWAAGAGIANKLLMCYPMEQEGSTYENLRTVRQRDTGRQDEVALQGMPVGVSLREVQGLSGSGVYELRAESCCEGAMGDTAGQYSGGDSCGRISAADALRGPVMGYHLATQRGWTALDLVLGRGQETHDLPVPVGMDCGPWSNPGGLCGASPQSGLVRRQDRESSLSAEGGAFPCPCAGAKLGALARASTGIVDLPDMRQGVSSFPTQAGERDASCEVLLAGLLPAGTPLYDLQVAEDHSFVIESLAAHNTNCGCALSYSNSKTGATY